MVARESTPIGAPCWVDLSTPDTDRSTAFYCSLLGWEAEEPDQEFGGYISFTLHGVRVAGCMANPDGPNAWSVYLTTDDARKTIDAAVTNGAQVLVDAMPVGDLGTMGFLLDPTGAAIGLWEAGLHKGSGLIAEHGAPTWCELYTRDHDAAVAFYRNVFRWDTKAVGATPEFTYTTQVEGDKVLAGIMDATAFLPEGVPAHWATYFAVDDVDASLEKVVELGGTVVSPAEDTPYGRLSAATDSTGAYFRLLTLPDSPMP